MATSIHIVYVRPVTVDVTGTAVEKDRATLGQMARGGNTEPRVIPVAGLASSQDYPTIAEYLLAEAANDFVLRHMDQNMIVTYPAGS